MKCALTYSNHVEEEEDNDERCQVPGDVARCVSQVTEDPEIETQINCHTYCVSSAVCTIWHFPEPRDGIHGNSARRQP